MNGWLKYWAETSEIQAEPSPLQEAPLVTLGWSFNLPVSQFPANNTGIITVLCLPGLFGLQSQNLQLVFALPRIHAEVSGTARTWRITKGWGWMVWNILRVKGSRIPHPFAPRLFPENMDKFGAVLRVPKASK